MPIKRSEIKAPIASEMKEFENKFRSYLETPVPLLKQIILYVVKNKGKQMRPMFVFLSAKLFGDCNETTYRGASMIELLHTASLVHDDVVDDATLRRGFFSINALWKNKIAVLVGDFMLSKLLLMAVKYKEYSLLDHTALAVEQMSEGELLQIEKARKLDITEEIYYEIIRKKTACLIGACCAIGARSVGQEDKVVDRMYAFGEKVGMAFQIKDDLFDYQTSRGLIGKPVGLDIREQKMTLPLIYTLQHAASADRKFIIRTVKRYNTDKKRIQKLLELVDHYGGISYAEGVMMDYITQVKEELKELPSGVANNALHGLLDYVIERKK